MLFDYDFRNYSFRLLAYMTALSVIGILVVRSATNMDSEAVTKQMFGILAGMAIAVCLSLVDYHKILNFSTVIYLICIGSLLAVLFWGRSVNNAKRWIEVPVLGQLQPSEFVKLTFVLFTASMFYQSTELKQVCITTAAAAAHVLILVLSKDLGGALILFVSYVLMLFIATGKKLYLFGGIGLGCGAAAAAFGLFDHVKRRVAAWKNPWADIDNTGYQITQSLFAIGTGGWFGMGLCQGMPGKIPVVEKDFIFAAIGEEFGGIFAVCLLLICLGCFIQFMMIASRMQAMFYKLIAFGLGIQYVTQVFLTVGGVTKFIPSTGVTLPFVSYGGSSIVSTFMLFAMIQGLYIIKRNDEEEMGVAED